MKRKEMNYNFSKANQEMVKLKKKSIPLAGLKSTRPVNRLVNNRPQKNHGLQGIIMRTNPNYHLGLD